jgi:hypothetical protein
MKEMARRRSFGALSCHLTYESESGISAPADLNHSRMEQSHV